jgi:AraC family transcriptional regulator
VGGAAAAGADGGVREDGGMADRLRELLDLVLGSLDDPSADGRALADRAHFSRDHLDRLLAGATGESPVALRRRLLLERAAWELRVAGRAPSEVAPGAGYGSLAAFSRAFTRAYGIAPSAFAASDRDLRLDAPNGIHFHPPGGLLVPGPRGTRAARGRDLTDRMVGHHLDRTRELLRAAATLPAAELARPLRPGFVAVWFEGEEASAALMAQRLVVTLEVWVAAMAGRPLPPELATDPAALLARHETAARAFLTLVRAIRDRGAWDDAFVDALCEPPQSFTYGGVVAHVLSFGAVRREMLASVLTELGVAGLATGDPVLWEQERSRAEAGGDRSAGDQPLR